MRPIRQTVQRVAIASCVFSIACLLGCHATKPLREAVSRTEITEAPRILERPMRLALARFGRMVRAYSGEDRPILVEIGLIRNDTGVAKELPRDLEQFGVNVLTDIGDAFRSFRAYPAFLHADGAASGGLALAPMKQLPRPDFKLKGRFLRFAKRVERVREATGDVLVDGRTQVDGNLSLEDNDALYGVRVSLSLESPDGITLDGCATTTELFLSREEAGFSFGLFVNGSGVGVSNRLKLSQDLGDALYDVMAASVIHVLGHALFVPYYRCHDAFPYDTKLLERFEKQLVRLTNRELDELIKRFLFAGGASVNMDTPRLTDFDRGIVAAEMAARALDPNDPRARVELAMDLWRQLDYDAAAARIEERLASNARYAKEQAERQQPVISNDSPTLFQWPAGTNMIVLDCSRLPENQRETVLKIASQTNGCAEIRTVAAHALAGLKYDATPSAVDLQETLSQAPELANLEIVWPDPDWRRVVLLPRRVPPNK